MRYTLEHKQETAAKIVASVGRGIRSRGFHGVGVDLLALDAGVTSGAFYKHFSSKSAAFEVVVTVGLDDFNKNIEHCIATKGKDWLAAVASYYFSNQHLSNHENSCALPTLTLDVSRGDESVKRVYERGLENIVQTMEKGLQHLSKPQRRRRAWAILTMLSGGAQIARAVDDRKLANEIASAMIKNVTQVGLAP